MKKFISALSSFVIAATAMGSTFAVSTDAATNTDVSETIFAFRSGEDKLDTVKIEAGKEAIVPVQMYIPQSSGFNQLSLKFTINGDKTLGQGSITAPDKSEVKNFKYAFGNYGIEAIADSGECVGFPDPCCLDSGWANGKKKFAGFANTAGMTQFTDYAMNVSYIANHAITREGGAVDIDAYAPWEAAGKPAYDSYTPVTTWTEDETWAYDIPFMDFKLKVPATVPEGEYVLDIYTGEYALCNTSALYDDAGKMLPDDQLTFAKSSVSGANPADKDNSIAKKFSSKPLKIVVGNPQPGQTDPTVTSTTTTTPQTTPGGSTVDTTGKIIYNLIPRGKEFTQVADNQTGNNTYNAKAGEDITIDWTVKNDGGTAGMQMFFDFSQVTYKDGNDDDADAYKVSPQVNDKAAAGVVAYNFGGATEMKAKDDQVIYSFNITAPSKDGTYAVGLKEGDADLINKVVPKDQSKPYEFIFHGLNIVVGENPGTPTSTTITTTSTTPQGGETVDPTGKIIYNLVPRDKEFTQLENNQTGNNVYNSKGDEEIIIDWTVRQDGGTAGMQMFFDFSQVTYKSGNDDDADAYKVSPQVNDKAAAGVVAYNFGGATEMKAKDDQVIYSFVVQVPKEKGSYVVDLKKNDADLINKVVPKDQSKPYEFIFHGLEIVVGDVPQDTTTTTTTTTSTTTITTTTSTTTSTTTTTTTTSTTPAPKDELLWGDANCDGKVKINDVVLINRSLAGTATLSDQGKTNADVVYNGTVDMNDVDKIKEFLAWLIPHSELGDSVRSSGLGYVNELGW